MIEADFLLSEAKARGFDFFTGVPCSFLTPIINRAISDLETARCHVANMSFKQAMNFGGVANGRPQKEFFL